MTYILYNKYIYVIRNYNNMSYFENMFNKLLKQI